MRSGQAPVLLSARDAAAYLGVSRSTFDRHVKDKVQSIDIHGRKYWTRAVLEAWAAGAVAA